MTIYQVNEASWDILRHNFLPSKVLFFPSRYEQHRSQSEWDRECGEKMEGMEGMDVVLFFFKESTIFLSFFSWRTRASALPATTTRGACSASWSSRRRRRSRGRRRRSDSQDPWRGECRTRWRWIGLQQRKGSQGFFFFQESDLGWWWLRPLRTYYYCIVDLPSLRFWTPGPMLSK